MMTALEKIKLWSAAVIVVASVYVAGYELGAQHPAARFGVLVGGLVMAAGLVWFSASGRFFVNYVRAAQVELRKVIWPTKEETLRMTGVVLIFVLIVMSFLWVVDFILSGLLEVLAS